MLSVANKLFIMNVVAPIDVHTLTAIIFVAATLT
jgi:hypothetical protein